MQIDGQTLVALAIVLLAAAVMLRRAARYLRGQTEGGCASCPSAESASGVKTLPLVQIGMAAPRRDHRGNIASQQGPISRQS